MSAEDFGQKVKILFEEIGDLKGQVCDLIIRSHDDFTKSCDDITSMAETSASLSQSAESIRKSARTDTLSHLIRTTKEHKELAAQLEQLGLVQDTLETIIELHKLLHSLEDALDESDLWKAVQLISSVSLLLPNMKVRKEDIRVFEALRLTYVDLKDRARCALHAEWEKAVSWQEVAEEQLCRLSIARAPADMERLVAALEVVGEARPRLCKLVQRAAASLLLPTVRGAADLSVRPPEGGAGAVFSARTLPEPRPVPPVALLDTLTSALAALSRHLLALPLGAGGERVADVTRYLLAEPLVGALIEASLAQSLPGSQAELDAFSAEVVPRVERFEEQLRQWGVLEAAGWRTGPGLAQYVREIDRLFLEKKRETLLAQGRELMRQPLFDIVPVGDEESSGDPGADADLMSFPRCLVSRSLVDLIALLDAAIDEGLATGTSDDYKRQIYFAVNNVIECYPRIVSTFHRDALAEVPQASAVFHCNCMFLAHRCLFDFRLSRLVPRGHFVHLVKLLRDTANAALLDQLARQRADLDELLAAAGDFQEAAERSSRLLGLLRQCCRRLGVLSRVWRVLPKHVFAQVIGTVANHVCARVVAAVCAIADISTDDCEALSQLLALLRDETLALFALPAADAVPQRFLFAAEDAGPAALSAQVGRYVAAWPRLGELLFVLRAGLADIAERWAAGKGPLAEAFSAVELKALVRALFQNTERRAAVLAKIR